jgi:prepilin-type N-terminal cleavage/methylation domain-containing protein
VFILNKLKNKYMTTARLTKKLTKLQKNQKGFTLIELLVVIGILAVLLAIVLIAINPARQFAQANNTQRASNINAILNAIHEYAADNHGNLPQGLTAAACTTVAPGTPCDISSTAGAGNVDLCAALVTTYIADLPVDPKSGTKSYTSGDCKQVGATYDTKYNVSVSANDNRITLSAPNAELPPTVITVTR